jgi:hypothetical protein
MARLGTLPTRRRSKYQPVLRPDKTIADYQQHHYRYSSHGHTCAATDTDTSAIPSSSSHASMGISALNPALPMDTNLDGVDIGAAQRPVAVSLSATLPAATSNTNTSSGSDTDTVTSNGSDADVELSNTGSDRDL